MSSYSAFKNGQLEAVTSKIKENVNLETIVVYVHGAPIFGEVGVKENRQKMEIMRGVGIGENNESRYKVHPVIFNWDGSFGAYASPHFFFI